jgi:hypothetical protein
LGVLTDWLFKDFSDFLSRISSKDPSVLQVDAMGCEVVPGVVQSGSATHWKVG